MENIICPKCGEKVAENPRSNISGIISCEKCETQIYWSCEKEKIYVTELVGNKV